MRPTDLLCLACEFRVAINEQSDMTTGCKFQYFALIWPPLTTHCMILMCNYSFVGAQRIESVLSILCHILGTVLTFNLSCVCVQVVRFQDFRPSISLPKNDRL